MVDQDAEGQAGHRLHGCGKGGFCGADHLQTMHDTHVAEAVHQTDGQGEERIQRSAGEKGDLKYETEEPEQHDNSQGKERHFGIRRQFRKAAFFVGDIVKGIGRSGEESQEVSGQAARKGEIGDT